MSHRWKSPAAWPRDLYQFDDPHGAVPLGLKSVVAQPPRLLFHDFGELFQQGFSTAFHLGALRSIDLMMLMKKSGTPDVIIQLTLLNDGQVTWPASKLCHLESNTSHLVTLMTCRREQEIRSTNPSLVPKNSCPEVLVGQMVQLLLRISLHPDLLASENLSKAWHQKQFALCAPEPFGVLMSFRSLDFDAKNPTRLENKRFGVLVDLG